ncbi:protein kinase [Trypanosoma theileri]|uniref:non-specific serine/threonine protein kinase n=1 Tax=Trypanosoma theileri TaxID=67003 RepID=A0A1X0P9C1_9TRYP|nr:protein kinase [Trypanosoma theileri]ORC93223.1 protein kinase [Trypanosoma theileri]
MGTHVSSCAQVVKEALLYARGFSSNSKHPSTVIIKGIEYNVGRILGEGANSFVYEGQDVRSGNLVALKRFLLNDQDQQPNQIMEEASLHRSLCPHPSIVTFYDSDVVELPGHPLPEVWIVMELCDDPSLANYINMRMSVKQPFAVREVYEICDCIVRIVAYLHSQSPPVSHWDIKAENFLFADSQNLKLCDFGSATRLYYAPKDAYQISIAEAELEEKMTLLYRSPESLDLWSKQRVDTKCDIWSLGVLVYLLVFFEMPFQPNTLEIIDGKPIRFRGEENTVPLEFRPLMEVVMNTMLVKDPSKRGDIFEVSNRLSAITLLPPVPRPRPGFQSSQRPRFE